MTKFVEYSYTVAEAFLRKDRNSILQILQIDNLDRLRTITDDNGDPLLHLAFNNAHDYHDSMVILENLIDLGADIDAKNSSGKTIFQLACERRQKSVIDLCILRNADLNISDNLGDTAAHFTIENERQWMSIRDAGEFPEEEVQMWHVESSSFVDWMLDNGVDFFYAKNQKGFSALYLANEYGLHHILLSLLERFNDLPSVEKGQTPLLRAFFEVVRTRASSDSQYNRYEPWIVKIILEKSKFISDDTLSSYLRIAITDTKHEMSVIDMLLQRASINVNVVHGRESWLEMLLNERSPSHEGRTIAQILYSRDPSIKMLQLLKDFKADFSAKDDRGRSFIYLISEYGDEAEMIDFVMNDSCDVNVNDSMGETPLHVAAKNRNINLAEALIYHGADVDIKDHNGKTPLHIASQLLDWKYWDIDPPSIARLLLKCGADVNAKDNMGRTPLHCVGEPGVVRVLLRFGAHLDMLDVNCYSPLQNLLAHKRPYGERILSAMLEYGADIEDSKTYELAFEMGEQIRFQESKYFIHYITKLIALHKNSGPPFNFGGLRNRNDRFFIECLKEVESLKNYFINDRTSLYCLLRKSRNQRCAYLKNEKLKNLVEDAAIERKFPRYSVLILGCYHEAARRKPLLKPATHILNVVIETFLPDLCIDKILTFMSNSDLLSLIEAFKNVNLDNLNEIFGKMNV